MQEPLRKKWDKSRCRKGFAGISETEGENILRHLACPLKRAVLGGRRLKKAESKYPFPQEEGRDCLVW